MKLYLITQQQNDSKTKKNKQVFYQKSKKIGTEDWGLLEISKLFQHFQYKETKS